jgi:uncharacterized protein YndB with AHSA1/START domain
VEQTTERLTVERTIDIEASPETVWRLLTDEQEAKRWWGLDASFDPTPGGEFVLNVVSGSIVRGIFLEVEPPSRLVYTFGWEKRNDGGHELTPPGSTTVEILLVPTGEGTTLTLTHRGLADETEAEQHGVGWEHYLGRLAITAAGGDPGPDPWLQQS